MLLYPVKEVLVKKFNLKNSVFLSYFFETKKESCIFSRLFGFYDIIDVLLYSIILHTTLCGQPSRQGTERTPGKLSDTTPFTFLWVGHSNMRNNLRLTGKES